MGRLLRGQKIFLPRRWGIILQGVVVLIWVLMMGLLVERTFWQPEDLRIFPAAAKEEIRSGEDWWGIYFQGEKIGYGVTTRQPQGEKVYVKEKVWLKLSILGTPQNIEQTLEYRTKQNLTLESFEFSLKSGLIKFRLAGQLEDQVAGKGKRLILKIHSGGKERQQEVWLKEVPHLLGQTKLYFLAQGLEKGKRYRIPAFDPSTLSNAEMIAEVEGLETLNIGGGERELFRVRGEFQGIKVKSWMDRSGHVWQEESPLGLVLMRESKMAAMYQNWSPGKTADLIALTAVPVNREIVNPRSTRYLRARLLSPGLAVRKIEGDRQRGSGNEVTIRQEEFPPPLSNRKSLPEEARQEALRPTPFIQSDDPAIKHQATSIVKGAGDPPEKVRRLAAWVYQELEKRPVVSLPSAVEVLRLKMGDCNEHAILFTALARAAGIPAQPQVGIVYQEGRFFYHAWAKVFVGSWVSVDPLLNQIPADATHICLAEGDLDRQLEIVKVIGRLRVEVLEVH